MHGTTLTCRCGYASPATVARCLGCSRRLARCERVAATAASTPGAARRPARAAVRSTVPAAGSRRKPPPQRSPWSDRDAARFGADPGPPASDAPSIPVAPLAVVGLVAAAWIAPDGPRAELLTAAALLGAALATVRPALPAEAAPAQATPPRPTVLTDDELRDAIRAW